MRSALDLIGENAGHIKQGLAKLTLQHRDGARALSAAIRWINTQ